MPNPCVRAWQPSPCGPSGQLSIINKLSPCLGRLPLVVGHYAEVSGFVKELAGVAAAAGAAKHWRAMRCRDPDAAYGVVLQMLRRSWGMAAFRENARLVVRRLTWVRDARAAALVVNTARDRARMGRRYENAMEHHPRRVGVRGRPSRNRGGGG